MDAKKSHNIFTIPLFITMVGPSLIFYFCILIYEELTP